MQEETATKPEMSHKEASWHATVAAIRARRKAALVSTAPEAREALALAAATGEPLPASPEFQPAISIGTLWAIEISGEHEAELSSGSRYADQALWALTLTQPERVLLSLISGDLDDLREGMVEASSMPAETYYALDAWYGREMDHLRTLAGGGTVEDPQPGKLSETPSPSSAAPGTQPDGQ